MSIDKVFNISNMYDSEGMLNEEGFFVLTDMHRTMTLKNWNRGEIIKYIAWNHGCHEDKATAMAEWAMEMLKIDKAMII